MAIYSDAWHAAEDGGLASCPFVALTEGARERERETSLIIIKIHIVHISDMKGKQEVPSAAS